MNIDVLSSHRKQEPESGVLYMVGTPIGNLDDISIRASNILNKVSCIACEDTRTTKKLLQHLNIRNKLISFHKYSSKAKLDFLISELKKGLSIALVSEAGMPSISDPGANLVREVRENDLDVICIPGPCAAITALVSSGIDSSRFAFYGFIPKVSKVRNNLLEEISESTMTSIIYESPKRILKLLHDIKILCGEDRDIVVQKELTKRYEQHFGFNINPTIETFKEAEPRGEFTVIITGKKKENKEDEFLEKSLKKDLLELIEAGLSHLAASNYLAKKSGKSKNYIYKLILKNNLQ